jgi:hypothetical protein
MGATVRSEYFAVAARFACSLLEIPTQPHSCAGNPRLAGNEKSCDCAHVATAQNSARIAFSSKIDARKARRDCNQVRRIFGIFGRNRLSKLATRAR